MNTNPRPSIFRLAGWSSNLCTTTTVQLGNNLLWESPRRRWCTLLRRWWCPSRRECQRLLRTLVQANGWSWNRILLLAPLRWWQWPPLRWLSSWSAKKGVTRYWRIGPGSEELYMKQLHATLMDINAQGSSFEHWSEATSRS